MKFTSVVLLAALAAFATADLDVHCLEEEILGTWTLQEGEWGQSPDVNCLKETVNPTKTWSVTLNADGTLYAASGDESVSGTWTMTYDESISAQAGDNRWFISFLYKKGKSICTETTNGWVRGAEHLPEDWACFSMTKDSVARENFVDVLAATNVFKDDYRLALDTPIDQHLLVESIHKATNLWTAKVYPEEEMKVISEALARAAKNSLPRAYVEEVSRTTPKSAFAVNDVPENFDWTNVDGVDFTSPIRNQGSCGSCWIFAAAGSLQDRVKVMTDGATDEVLSHSEILDCDLYGQGCDGGLPYLAYAYVQDHGLMTEADYPYKAKDRKCKADASKKFVSATDYHYTGGRYGACTEDAMIEELLAGGPMPVAFYVYRDFMNYSGGSFPSPSLGEPFGEFMEVNHGVRLVGYGVTNDGTPFWNVANSWGSSWGEKGYFKILRGTNECAIENQAVSVDPILL